LLPATCAQPGRDCDILVQGTISRKAFGMNAYRAVVKDNVDFHIRVRLRPATPAP
jgi:polyisoprenoid-binding protein YceI